MPEFSGRRFSIGIMLLLVCADAMSATQADTLADQLRAGKNRPEREAAALALVALGSSEAKDALVAIVADINVKANAREIALSKLSAVMLAQVTTQDVKRIVIARDYKSDVYNAALQHLAPAVKLDEPTIVEVLEVYRAGARKSAVLICCQAQHAKFAKDPSQKALLNRVVGPFLLTAARAPVESAEVLDYLGWCLVEYGLPGGPEVLIRSLREQKAADEGEGV
ncbi:MAG: hypothetical protein H0U72_05280, partial [Nitrosospira sp.]|nr:hypothetical protein [Nitrosospira sp.]